MNSVNIQNTNKPLSGPCVLFMGDFNAGKSTLINALLRRDTLYSSREESLALPTFVSITHNTVAHFVAMAENGAGFNTKTHEEFKHIRRDMEHDTEYLALGAQLPDIPFNHLTLVDSMGMSGDSNQSLQINNLLDVERAMMVVVTDIEYWSARHTMDFILYHRNIFGDNLVVVANKADHLNAHEIRRICDNAPKRMESFGIKPAPKFLALSARLELARQLPKDEYRHRTKREVRELCDAGFDALRVAMYEFESACCRLLAQESIESRMQAPLPASFIKLQEGVR